MKGYIPRKLDRMLRPGDVILFKGDPNERRVIRVGETIAFTDKLLYNFGGIVQEPQNDCFIAAFPNYRRGEPQYNQNVTLVKEGPPRAFLDLEESDRNGELV